MKYILDKEFKYKNDLLKLLREYNLKHTGEREWSSEYFYALEGEKLIGAVYTNFSWDWVGISNVFYKDINVLKKLISEISNYYKDKAVGMKLYTEVESRLEDFKSIGFNLGGITEKTPRTPRYFYLKNTDFNVTSNAQVEVIIASEKIDNYDSIFLKQLEKFDRDNNIIESTEEIDIMYVALDDDKFVGGVHGSITEDSMYIGWLVVDEDYRGNRIGEKLMHIIEDKAKELQVYSINLGTVEFQALKFYEKLGYKVVFTKENDPKGYKSYNLVKVL